MDKSIQPIENYLYFGTFRVICSLRSHSERSLDIIPGGQHLFGISQETRWGTMIGRIHSRSPSGSITILICST